MKFYRIELSRENRGNVILGTVPTLEDMDVWMQGAYKNKLLPDPPFYSDELQVFEVESGMDLDPEKITLILVWCLTWHMFEVHMVDVQKVNQRDYIFDSRNRLFKEGQ